jgi:hypothetical protein
MAKPLQINAAGAISASPELITSGNLTTDLALISSSNVTLHINVPTILGASSVTVPSNVRLLFSDNGTISIESNETLTLSCSIQAGLFQIFTCRDYTSNLEFTYGSVVYPEWWGVVAGQYFTGNPILATNGDALRTMLRSLATYGSKEREVRFQPGAYSYSGRLDFWTIDPFSTWRFIGEQTTIYCLVTQYDCAVQLGNAYTSNTAYNIKFDGISWQQLAGSPKYADTSVVQINKCNDFYFGKGTYGGHDFAIEVAGEGSNHWKMDQISVGNGVAKLGRNRYGRRLFTVDSATNIVTCLAHNLVTGTPIKMVHGWEHGSRLPNVAAGDALIYAVTYYFIKIDANTGKIARTRSDALAGTAIDFTDNGVGTLRLTSVAGLSSPQQFTVDTSTNILTITGGHTFADNATVRVAVGPNNPTATLPTASGGDLHKNDMYYVEYLSSSTVGLRRTSAGGRIDLTSAGSGMLIIGSAYEVVGQQFNGGTWDLGKIDDPGDGYDGTAYYSVGPTCDVFAIATMSFTNHDFSNNQDGSLLIEDCSEIKLSNIYSEAIGPGTAGNDVDVIHIRNCKHLSITDSRINGAWGLSNNCGTGIRISGAIGAGYEFLAPGAHDSANIYIGTCVFTRHQKADIYVDVGTDADSVVIESNSQTDGVSTGRVRIANATGRRINHNYLGRKGLPEVSGNPAENFIPSQDFNHFTWTLSDGAVVYGTTTAPDGFSTAQVLDLPRTPNTTPSGTSTAYLARGSSGKSATIAVSLDQDLASKVVLFRFWYKPISIIATGSEDTGRFYSHVLRESIGGDPTSNQLHEYEGVWDGYGEWTFASHRYVIQNDLHNPASYANSTLYSLGLSASNQGGSGGVRVAIWGMDLVVIGLDEQDPPYDPYGTATNVNVGLMSQADKTSVDVAFAARIRKRAKKILYTDLPASTSHIVNLGLAPAGSRVLGASIVGKSFTGGGMATTTCDIGSSNDADAIVEAANVRNTFIDEQASTLPDGIAPNKMFSTATTLQATLTSTGANLNTATDGYITPEVMIWVPRSTIEPTDITDCALWLPSGSEFKAYSGSEITDWYDQSGNDVNFTQSTSSARPKIGRNHNGRPTVLFDGTDDRLTSTKQTKDVYDTLVGSSVYMVLSIEMSQGSALSTSTSSWSDTGGIFSEDTGFFSVFCNETQVGLSSYNGADNNTRIFTNYSKGMIIISYRIDFSTSPDTFKIRINNNSQTTQSVNGLVPGLDVYNLRIGSTYGGGIFARFRMLEMCAWKRPLTDNEDSQVRAYLSEIAGI